VGAVSHLELLVLFLLLAVVALTGLARHLRVPYPIFLVIGGSLLGFAPGVPDVELDPDLVLLLFLPPLLFNLAYFASLRDLRRDLRTISLQSVGLVLVTAGAVAVVFHAVVPGLPWAAAFAFGAIVSPTDPLAAVEIARRLGVPRRMINVIEGESLVNDGTALVVYRTAVAAATGATFDLLSASGDFVLNVAGGVVVGIAAAFVLVLAFRRLNDDVLGVTLSLAAGYCAYIPAEQVGVSGVIAAVTVGLVLGQRSHTISTAGARIRGASFWEVLVFLLNAVLFVLVGLQLPGILAAQERSGDELLALGTLAAGVVIATRLVWVHTTPYLVRALDRRPSQVGRRVGWRPRTVSAWSGMRGSVSLAAALALPTGFPERDLLIFLTLCVIFGTLVFQGLTLPYVIRGLGVHDDGEAEREESRARKAAAQAAITRLAELREEDWTREDTIERLERLFEFRYRRMAQRAGYFEDGDEDLDARSASYQRLMRLIYDCQREELVRLRDDGVISSEVMHTVERELDLEDERLEI
jgi:Na+/H+ antiporter